MFFHALQPVHPSHRPARMHALLVEMPTQDKSAARQQYLLLPRRHARAGVSMCGDARRANVKFVHAFIQPPLPACHAWYTWQWKIMWEGRDRKSEEADKRRAGAAGGGRKGGGGKEVGDRQRQRGVGEGNSSVCR